MWTFNVPLYVQVSKKKRFYLNLNGYRNEHHQTLSKAKVLYAAIVKPLLTNVPRNLGRIHVAYKLFPRTRVELDTANVLCIVDKFVCDCLVANKIIGDDNHKVVISVHFSYGHVDPIDPRAEVTLTLDQSGDTTLTDQPSKDVNSMKMQLNQVEIEAAITAYVMNTVSVQPGYEINIDLRATRGPQGYSAEIDISPSGTAAAQAASNATTAEAPASVGTDQPVETAEVAPAADAPASEPTEEAEAPAAAEVSEEPASGRASLFAAG